MFTYVFMCDLMSSICCHYSWSVVRIEWTTIHAGILVIFHKSQLSVHQDIHDILPLLSSKKYLLKTSFFFSTENTSYFFINITTLTI